MRITQCWCYGAVRFTVKATAVLQVRLAGLAAYAPAVRSSRGSWWGWAVGTGALSRVGRWFILRRAMVALRAVPNIPAGTLFVLAISTADMCGPQSAANTGQQGIRAAANSA
jgi:hypothetical protein